MTGHEKCVLIVSPYFPPSTLAGVHRARLLAKHLPAAGWKPTILCVHESCHEEPLDPQLAELAPSSVEIIKVGALPSLLTRRLGIGDLGLRSWYSIREALRDLAGQRRFDAALITGAPFYPMLSAALLSSRGIPVTLDFQDPWVSPWGASQPPLSKAGLSHRLATWLEPRALKSASYVTSVSTRQNSEMAARYDWLDASCMAGIPIGGDPEDFEFLRRARPPGGGILSAGQMNLSFVGTYADRFEPVILALLKGLKRLCDLQPDVSEKIRLNFIGTSARPDGYRSYRVKPLADRVGVAHLIHETPQRLPYVEALNAMACSDGLLLIGSDEPHYTASRIYPALMSGRPNLSIYHKDSSGHALLAKAGGGVALSFGDIEDLTELEPRIAEGLKLVALHPSALGSIDAAAYEPFNAAVIARRFAAIFEASARQKNSTRPDEK